MVGFSNPPKYGHLPGQRYRLRHTPTGKFLLSPTNIKTDKIDWLVTVYFPKLKTDKPSRIHIQYPILQLTAQPLSVVCYALRSTYGQKD